MSESQIDGIVWGDGPQTFELAIGELRELQDKCNAGPQRILGRISTADWLIEDIRETIRLGLIGGGKPPAEAYNLVKRYIDDRKGGWLENRAIAQIILMKALVGDPTDQVGKSPADQAKPETTTASPGPLSSDGDQSSDIAPAT